MARCRCTRLLSSLPSHPLTTACRLTHAASPPYSFPRLQAELGESTAALFTRDGEQANSLFDMQAMWYEVASGRAYLAQRQYGKVRCLDIVLHTHIARCQPYSSLFIILL